MPLLKIQTNIPLTGAQRQALLKPASETVASLLGKPERYIMIQVEAESAMLFAGSEEPSAYMELKSIGLPADKTEALSASLCEIISSKLEIPPARIYIEFADVERNMWGWNNTTF